MPGGLKASPCALLLPITGATSATLAGTGMANTPDQDDLCSQRTEPQSAGDARARDLWPRHARRRREAVRRDRRPIRPDRRLQAVQPRGRTDRLHPRGPGQEGRGHRHQCGRLLAHLDRAARRADGGEDSRRRSAYQQHPRPRELPSPLLHRHGRVCDALRLWHRRLPARDQRSCRPNRRQGESLTPPPATITQRVSGSTSWRASLTTNQPQSFPRDDSALIRELALLLDETEPHRDRDRARRPEGCASRATSASPPRCRRASMARPHASRPPQPRAAVADLSKHPGVVPSPMVGTAYWAPEPGAKPFIEVGAKVSVGQTLADHRSDEDDEPDSVAARRHGDADPRRGRPAGRIRRAAGDH